ncbi:DNA-directed RNA polymerase sigma-70 factor [Kitasatospora indigofera]|uniref:DNA-directed RNA polymerase sigma-70 factor n=1 Tax=Kitasatospora indigofera TaxID=67307 RepID=A0A919KK15_9ACTN|nr:SigE family RNA polymerase sigma factor [Kitasatospora indigofera]GHH60221.1 DNA-directed RNA polymerase sigma-70 factor [Kitasatospora indigofera]
MGERTAARDAEFQVFVTTAWPRLSRTAFLLAGDRHTAEDLVQTTLEKTYVAWARVRRTDDPYAYVRRILLNEQAGRFRRRLPEFLVPAVPERPAADAYDRADDRTGLLRALAALPPRQRQAVVLRYWEDLSESQAAAAMNCSVGTVKSQASKGIAKLRAAAALGALTRVGGSV